MKRIDINVPQGIRYLGKWNDFGNIIPYKGKIILNKSLPDCGATTWYLTCEIPVILASPRLCMLESKAKKHPDVFYFNSSSELSLSEYLINCYISGRPPKIMVTYDSLEKLLSHIKSAELSKYTIVIDEMQCLIGDAAFKGDSVLKVVNVLETIDNVVYLSATVYEDSYLDNMDMFKNLQYYRLVWPNGATRPIQTLQIRMKTVRKQANEIIQKFKTLGYFETKILNGQQVFAYEAVFFLNSVNEIIDIIRDNSLSSQDVNILCSDKAEKRLYRKVKCRKGEAPQEGEPHKTYTFVTKASFEGTDFNSTNAYTYIFCDPNLDNMALDLYIDIPQIMGRQRLECNPFKYEATIFYKTTLHYDSEADFAAHMQKKECDTQKLLYIYNQQNEEGRNLLMGQYESAHETDGFDKNYLSVITDFNGNKVLHINNMVKVAEVRAWDIQSHQYCNEIRILAKLEENGINAGYVSTPNDEITRFINCFTIDNNFERKMKLYCDYRDDHPAHSDMLEALTHLPVEFHKYYRILGSNRIRALSYKEKNIKDEILFNQGNVGTIIRKTFLVGKRYLRNKIKETLQQIYADLGIAKSAKATDLERYFELKPVAVVTKKKTERGYEILSVLPVP